MMLAVGLLFIQAEDGMRDIVVTGVQTCALPISRASVARRVVIRLESQRVSGKVSNIAASSRVIGMARKAPTAPKSQAQRVKERRSEERRVGKDGRCRGYA